MHFDCTLFFEYREFTAKEIVVEYERERLYRRGAPIKDIGVNSERRGMKEPTVLSGICRCVLGTIYRRAHSQEWLCHLEAHQVVAYHDFAFVEFSGAV